MEIKIVACSCIDGCVAQPGQRVYFPKSLKNGSVYHKKHRIERKKALFGHFARTFPQVLVL